MLRWKQMSLSLLAVLLTGCEPMAFPEVDANPLVSVKGDEPAIDTPAPVSGGRSLLASDDDPDEDDDWVCDDVQDCWERCEEWDSEYDSGTSSCKCKPMKGGGWSCDAKWWEDEGPGGDDGGGGTGCGGGGGGIGPGDTLAGRGRSGPLGNRLWKRQERRDCGFVVHQTA